MRPANNDRQRRHRNATSKAVKATFYPCPKCDRRQNRSPIDISGLGHLLWICRYCGHEWDRPLKVDAPDGFEPPTF